MRRLSESKGEPNFLAIQLIHIEDFALFVSTQKKREKKEKKPQSAATNYSYVGVGDVSLQITLISSASRLV
jgi:hypothetical protein